MATVFADTIKGTTICAVKRNDKIAIAGDGQVTQGESVIMKGNAVKVRRIFDNKIVIGFAGTTADAFTLSEKLESICYVLLLSLLNFGAEITLCAS